ncbi:uncharacterized protein LOC144134535 [Amblyomma americanum]
MTGSVGAATAVMSGRGNRAFASDEEYQVILPTLPTGRVVLNTVFLHADVRARPYRVEDFRDALAQLMLLPEVIALGAYRMSHVWAVTFASAEAVTKILSAGDLKVKDRRCLVIDPANQDVRVKLHWLLHNVPDEDVRVAFAPYGKVSEVSKERWRVQGVASKGSTTRLVSLKMNPGVKLEDLPHEVRVGGELALVVVPGRAPLCLRCHGTGHIRRECKVPRCGACRRYGHEESSCVRTYASAAVPVNTDISSELVMDEADAEDAAAEAGDSVEKAPAVPPTEISTSDEDAVKKIVSAGELVVKKCRCLVIDPANQDVRMKVHWLLHSVSDDDVKLAFAAFGKVTDVARERWRVQGMADKGSTTRLVILKLKPGVKLDDIPHQDASALLMDAADMEETSTATTATAAGETNAVETSQQDKIVAEEGVTIREPAPRQDAGPRSEGEVKSPVATGALSIPPDPVSMDMSSGAANLAAGKRPHDDGESTALQQDGNGGDEPPSKAAVTTP